MHLNIDQKSPSPTMNLGLMTVHHNEPENVIGDPEDFSSISADS